MTNSSRYSRLIEHVFFSKYKSGDREVLFSRTDLVDAASELNIKLPKNLGDIVYSFRYRVELPNPILMEAPEDEEWVIMPAGRAFYKFVLISGARILPRDHLALTKIPDATPGMIERYSLSDEQALLAKLRYNRLIDIFTGLTCFSLQNHLRTYIEGMGQVETDEVYIGVDKIGAHYVIPVQAKGSSDQIGIIQIEQDFEICRQKFPDLIPIPVAAQIYDVDQIALFSFEKVGEQIRIASERHYCLVGYDELTKEEVENYKKATRFTF